MKRVRVAIVSDAIYPWHKGGKEIRYEHLSRNLLNHDMDVTVYSMKWWDATPTPIITAHGTLRYRALCPRMSLYRKSRRSMLQAAVFAISTFGLLAFRYDVIEADHMPYLQLMPIRIVAWIRQVPLIVTWHEVWGKSGWRSYIGRVGFIPALIERFSTRIPDVIVAVSEGTAEKLISIGAAPRRITVIPNALNLEQLSFVTPDPLAPDLLFVGRLISHKCADLAIEATRILVSRGHDVRLGIVGVGPEEDRLHEAVSKADLEDRVKFYSTIESQVALWSLMRGSRVLLAPSVREGFGIIVAESLALGTPVVCVKHVENESYRLVCPSTGSVVSPFDALGLADSAEMWLEDVSDRRERSSSFLGRNPSLSVDDLAKSYVRLVRQVA